MVSPTNRCLIFVVAFLWIGLSHLNGSTLRAGELWVGAASVSITPDQPVALSGQMRTRVARKVESPIMASVVAVESREGEQSLEQALMVSCDLVAIREGIIDKVRERLGKLLPEFDPRKIFLSATHTHTAPEVREGVYHVTDEDVITPTAYTEFLVDRIAEVAAQAWKSRQPGLIGWGLGHAIVAQNRRATYANGNSVMYGKTTQQDFLGFEAGEDHGVEVLCFWNRQGDLLATAINVACPAQEVEGRSAVNADFWHQIRKRLQTQIGPNLVVLGWTGAAGDQSPHLMYRKEAEERMRKLRRLDRLEEIAVRVVAAWNEAYQGAVQEQHSDLPFTHLVQDVELPPRLITVTDVEQARASIAAFEGNPAEQWRQRWHRSVIDRFEKQQQETPSPYKMELHALRIGDIAIATNPFELYTEYGMRIKSRSPALQTFLIQLAGPGSYLPTPRAVKGGGYSAIAESSIVGPDGGDALVDHTLKAIDSLWTTK